MKMKKNILLWVLLAVLAVSAQAQQPAIPGQLIVFLQPEARLSGLLSNSRAAWDIQPQRNLGQLHNIHLLRVRPGQEEAALQWLARQPEVIAAQRNYPLAFRGEPNDPFYGSQWTLERVSVPDVWAVTTGGLSSRGDTIVVAVLDNGFDITHPDLQPNLWRNRTEIPADGLDNDANGFVDDVNGWNFSNDSPTYTIGSGHGHSVAGIIGARGDNNTGVAGINWHIKLMLLNVAGVDQIIEAYEYVIEQRQRYNQSRGATGAFIVATNASFGQDRVFCSQQPVWGAMYDLLGEQGVLTGAGTDNSRYDVEELGDMPATCPSEYLIVTLNTTDADAISQSSAYGRQSIDLGSPGDDTYTIKPANGYGSFGGNSAAAPHLTGAIALLYSLPCEALGQDALDNPAATARFIRRAILQGVDPVNALDGRTVTGGRLNLLRSMEVIQADCGTTTGPLALQKVYPVPADNSLFFEYESPDFEPFDVELFDLLGRLVFRDRIRAPRFGLKRYEVPVLNLATGAYFLRLTKKEETVVRQVVIH